MSCTGLNVQCTQDEYYNEVKDSPEDFNPNMFIGLDKNKNKIFNCDNAKLLQAIQKANPCEDGYVLVDQALQVPCAFARQYNQFVCTGPGPNDGCTYAFYWYLQNACRPQVPNPNIADLALCCSTGFDCSNAPYCCPPQICKDSNNCGLVMAQFCQGKGLNDPQCNNYFNTSSNQGAKQFAATNYIQNQLTQNNVPLDQQPNLSQIAAMCNVSPPGTCDSIMKKSCAQYSREEIEANPNLATLCGCFMNSKNYQQYSALTGGFTQCDPACMNAYAVQPQSSTKPCTYGPCTSPICIIDFRNKNVQKLWTSGIDINQNCYATGGVNPSKCFIGMSKDDAKIYLAKDFRLSQTCDACFLFDPTLGPNAQAIPIDCANPAGSIANHYGLPIPSPSSNIYIILGVGLITLIFIIFLVITIKKIF